ncbi:MAG: flagellar hook-basal body complex protein FliE [Desulfobacterota bacterium]|nr:flagellar hook-basal body complex protein FliE [Thermodesulfobacteriota bacterium]
MKVDEILDLGYGFRPVSVGERTDPFTDFKKVLSRSIEELNRLSEEANQKIEEMVLGEADIHEAMIAMEKAGISLRLMLQVRNKMIAAYEEIMRMQF